MKSITIKRRSDPVTNSQVCPYCTGSTGDCDNLVLSFVVEEGILQRLYDTTDDENVNWSIRVFECTNPLVTAHSNQQYSDRPIHRKPACGYDLIIVPTPNHDIALSELSIDQWTKSVVGTSGQGEMVIQPAGCDICCYICQPWD